MINRGNTKLPHNLRISAHINKQSLNTNVHGKGKDYTI